MKKSILFVLILTFLSSISFADEYVLVMSKKDNVCQHMLKRYNEDLRKYGEVRYDEHEEFKVIKWKEKKYYTTFPDGKKHYPIHPLLGNALISRFDINNDGKEEIVIKDKTYFKSVLSENLYYFENINYDYFEGNEFDVYSVYPNATGSICGGPGSIHNLKELPQFLYLGIGNKESKSYYSLGLYLSLNPFFFDGTYYVDIKDEVPFVNVYSSKFLVIQKFSQDNQANDICYYIKTCERNKNRKGVR